MDPVIGVVETPELSRQRPDSPSGTDASDFIVDDEARVQAVDVSTDITKRSPLSWDARQLQEWATVMESQVAQARIEARCAMSEVESIREAHRGCSTESAIRSETTVSVSIDGAVRRIVAPMLEAAMSLAMSSFEADFAETADLLRQQQASLAETQRSLLSSIEHLRDETDKRTRKLKRAIAETAASVGSVKQAVDSISASGAASTQAELVKVRARAARTVALQLAASTVTGLRRETFRRWLSWGAARRARGVALRQIPCLLAKSDRHVQAVHFKQWLWRAHTRRVRRIGSQSEQHAASARASAINLFRGRCSMTDRRIAFQTWQRAAAAHRKQRALASQVAMILSRSSAQARRAIFSAWASFTQRAANRRTMAETRRQLRQSKLQSLRSVALTMRSSSLQNLRRSVFMEWTRSTKCRMDRRNAATLALQRLSPVAALRRHAFGLWQRWVRERFRSQLQAQRDADRDAVRARATQNALRIVSLHTSSRHQAQQRLAWHMWSQFTNQQRHRKLLRSKVSNLLFASAAGIRRRTYDHWQRLAHRRAHTRQIEGLRAASREQRELMQQLVAAEARRRITVALGVLCRSTSRQSMLCAYRTWGRVAAQGRKDRLRTRVIDSLRLRVRLSSMHAVFTAWMQTATRRRATAQRHQMALHLLQRNSRKADTFVAFCRWREFARTSAAASRLLRARVVKSCFSKWRVTRRARCAAQERQRHLAMLLQGGAVGKLGTSAVNETRRRILTRWMQHHAVNARLVARADAVAERRLGQLRGTLFRKWLRRAEGARGVQIEGASFIAQQQHASMLDDLAHTVAVLERESNTERDALTGVSRQLQGLVGSWQRLAASKPGRLDRLRSLAVECGVSVADGTAGSRKDPALAAVRSASSVNELLMQALEEARWHPTVPRAPTLTAGGSRYCECCFDKRPCAVHGTATGDASEGSFVTAGRMPKGSAAAICQRRFVATARCIDALQLWMLQLEERLDSSGPEPDGTRV